MSRENVRIRILDALENGPATVFDLTNLVVAHINTVRHTCTLLEQDNIIECIADQQSHGDRGVGRSWKVYAIKGSA